MRTVVALSLFGALVGCGQSSPSGKVEKELVSVVASAASEADATGQESEFPLTLEPTLEMAEAADAATAYSQLLDDKCALMTFDEETEAKRPVVKGKKLCPRPDGDAKTWGAQ